MKRTPIKRGSKMLQKSGFKPKGTLILKRTKKPTQAKNKPHKAKEKTITWHRKQLWTLFSKYIRERDKYTCFTCGKVARGGAMHAGHFITGATCTAKLYFDEMNVNAQCYHDNINLSGNWVMYERNMIVKYGKEKVEELKLRRTLEMGHKVDIFWYKEKIEYYKKKLEQYENNS